METITIKGKFTIKELSKKIQQPLEYCKIRLHTVPLHTLEPVIVRSLEKPKKSHKR